jgi:hypothetical protein
MFSRHGFSKHGFSERGSVADETIAVRLLAGSLALGLTLALAGCASSLSPHVTALSAATAPVVDQATAAYRNAQAIHAESVNYDAAASFDQTNVFVPSSVQAWPSDNDIQVRLAVLTAFQLYVKDLTAITGGTDSPALDAASTSMGESLMSLANTVAPSVEGALGVTPAPSSTTETTISNTFGNTTTTSSSSLPPLVSPGTAKVISVAIDALGQFLVNRTIEKELPQQIEAMDPHVQTLCELLSKDIEIIQEQEKIDSNDVIDKQTEFLRTAKLDPEERRVEFMKLPDMARRQSANDLALTELRAALVNLEMTHHALAAAAQGNNPESLTERLKDLSAAGESLGKLYGSLSPAN